MSRAEKMEKVMETESGAERLLKAIIGNWGIKDFLYCAFDVLPDEDQDKVLDEVNNKFNML